MRRSRAACSFVNGLYWEGAWGSPARSAASFRPSSSTRLVEEDLRGRLHPDRRATRGGPVGGGVHVLLEDLLLRVRLLVLLRHRRLDDLALEAVLGLLDVEVADELLGDRRGALLDLAGLEVLHGRADDRGAVDAVVLVEVLVLDRDRRLLQRLAGSPRSRPACGGSPTGRSRGSCPRRRRPWCWPPRWPASACRPRERPPGRP